MEFLKIRTVEDEMVKQKTLWIQVINQSSSGILGRVVNPTTMEDKSTIEDGVVIDRQQFFHKSAILWTEDAQENKHYGILEVVPGTKKYWNDKPSKGEKNVGTI